MVKGSFDSHKYSDEVHVRGRRYVYVLKMLIHKHIYGDYNRVSFGK